MGIRGIDPGQYGPIPPAYGTGVDRAWRRSRVAAGAGCATPIVRLANVCPCFLRGMPNGASTGRFPPSQGATMHTRPHDMSPPIDMTRRRATGPARGAHPVYVDLLPPCNNACPAGEDIQGWLGLAQAGKYREAWETLVRDNPMPAVHGRVCYHPCETACNRGELDAPVEYPRGRAVPRRSRHGGGLGIQHRHRAERQARAGHRRGAERPVGRLSPRPHRATRSKSMRRVRSPAA